MHDREGAQNPSGEGHRGEGRPLSAIQVPKPGIGLGQNRLHEQEGNRVEEKDHQDHR